jgi:hypothetical protein
LIEIVIFGLNILLFILIATLQYTKYKEKNNPYAIEPKVINGITIVVVVLLLYINIIKNYIISQ